MMRYEFVDEPQWRYEFVDEAPTKKESSTVKNIAGGVLRGAGSIGATLLTPLDATARFFNDGKPVTIGGYEVLGMDRRKAMDSALDMGGVDRDSWAFQVAKLGTEIAGTSGAGGVLGNVATRLGFGAPVAQALASGGFAAKGASLPVRMAAGAATGAASAGLVNPDDAATGALIGGALPGVVKAGGFVGSKVAEAYRKASAPEKVKIAEQLVKATGMSKEEVLTALNQQGPQLIHGYQKTVPQILQKPELSQLQRTLKTAGSHAIGDAERLQQAQMMETLRRVSPVAPTVQDAAEKAGSAIQRTSMGAYDDATEAVRRAFNGIDPFNEAKVYLPMDEMAAAKSKYLGAGTFGTGSNADKALKVARSLGEEVLPDVKMTKAPPQETLARAVRRAGGIKGKSGELRDLGIKQSGTTGLVNNKSGRDMDILAEEMYQRGYLSSPDPDELISALRDGSDRVSFDVSDEVLQRMSERAMGDAPVADVMGKTVPYEQVKNLRSSIGEAARKAELDGSLQESAALKQMVSAIDDKINAVANGVADAGEYFPQDIADAYKQARALHAAKIDRFKTGPQIGLFRKGSDGLPAVQGAEIPGKFYSSRASQADDMRAFKKLVGNDKAMIGELKSFATTQAANTTDAKGNLTSKYVDWLKSRSGANRELFSATERKQLDAIGKAVQSQMDAENLGRVSGSDTAQKLASLQSNGLLDNPAVDFLANRIPVVKSVSGPVLGALRKSAANQKNEVLSGLLADPEELMTALQFVRKARQPGIESQLIPYLLRPAPVVLSGSE